MKPYFVYDGIDMLSLHVTAEEAMAAAQTKLDELLRQDPAREWSFDVVWGEVRGTSVNGKLVMRDVTS